MVTAIRPAHFCPLAYFLRSRYHAFGTQYAYLTLNIGFCLLAIAISHGQTMVSASAVAGYLAAWVIFTIIYELGYLLNDSWSAKREQKRGYRRAGIKNRLLNSPCGTGQACWRDGCRSSRAWAFFCGDTVRQRRVCGPSAAPPQWR